MIGERSVRRFRNVRVLSCAALLVLAASGTSLAQDPNACDVAGESPDLVISDIVETRRFGNVGGITAFSLGTTTCNLGNCWANYSATTSLHPAFAQNMFRLGGGKFEQIGQSWVAHRFIALPSPGCPATCIPSAGTHLGVGCSTTDIPVYAGAQGQLGPRFEVNPVTGIFQFPATDQSLMGDAIFKRLQVHDQDLDPVLNPGALYFVEGIHVAEDDAGGGNQQNNASYRPVDVSASQGVFDIALSGLTREEQPALLAWVAEDPAVTVQIVDVPADGRFLVGSKATPLGGGLWHYEYAVQNLSSHRAAVRFQTAIPPGAWNTNFGFHDVDYHSGEPFDGTDWTPSIGGVPGAVAWTTATFGENPDANALRWGTLYNFRFDSASPPATGKVTVGLFRPGTPSQVDVAAVVPATCTLNGSCASTENECSCPADCGAPAMFELSCSDLISNDCDGLIDCADPDCCSDPTCVGVDADADGVPVCVDCDDADNGVWAVPGEPTSLAFESDTQTLGWTPPVDPGGAAVFYETLVSSEPSDFVGSASCLADDGVDTSATATATPGPGNVFFYLVRARNACPFGHGSLGAGSGGQPRPGLACH